MPSTRNAAHDHVATTAAAPEIERATPVVLGADAVFSNGVSSEIGRLAVGRWLNGRTRLLVTRARGATTACAWMH